MRKITLLMIIGILLIIFAGCGRVVSEGRAQLLKDTYKMNRRDGALTRPQVFGT